MFTTSDRKELIEIFDNMKKEASELLETDNVIPDSMTNNGAKVGITIEFRKLYEKDAKPPSPPPPISNASE